MSGKWFSKFSSFLSTMTGRPVTFVLAVVMVIVWALTGPLFHYSDTWQLVINTSTTIVTFLMVFLIQNTQNRDTAAMQTTRRASSQPREVMDWLRPPRSGEVRPIVLGDRNGK